MKLLTAITFSILTTIALQAKTTMCFKENHKSMATIESIPLDGGLCSSIKSIQDMKKDGWIIDDIKIENKNIGKNYIYILKKDEKNLSLIDENKLEQKILAKLEKRKKEEIENQKRDITIRMSKNGKELYKKQCQSCHGIKADLLTYNTSRALVSLNYNDMKLAIRDYSLGDYNRGRAFIMRPYAIMLSSKDIKNVYSYIQSLKPQTKKDKTKK